MLKLHYLRWVLFDIGKDTYFMYQGIFDTDFDKYTEDAVALFTKYGLNTIFENLEGFPEDWKTNTPAFIKFVREHQRPSFLEYGEYPYVDRGRDQEGPEAEGGVLGDARPDAVIPGTRAMLELDDIQHILLTRTPALTGRYEFVSFRDPAGGQAWVTALLDKVQSAAEAGSSVAASKRWVTVAFTWNGLRALGVDEGSLATFPEEFKQGMVARAEMLGDTGVNHPGQLGGRTRQPRPARHRDPVRPRRAGAGALSSRSTRSSLAQCPGVELLSSLDLEATPPFDYAHDHFGYRDRLSQPVMEGSGEQPTPGSGAPLKPGEFILGYPDEDGPQQLLPQPEILSRNGSFLAYRRLQEHVGRVSRLPRAARQDRRGAGAGGGEAHGPLAQRRAAGAGAGEGRSGAGRGHAAQQRLQLQGNGPARVRDAAGLALPPDEPARYRAQHEPAADDPARARRTARRCPRARRKTASSAASRPS